MKRLINTNMYVQWLAALFIACLYTVVGLLAVHWLSLRALNVFVPLVGFIFLAAMCFIIFRLHRTCYHCGKFLKTIIPCTRCNRSMCADHSIKMPDSSHGKIRLLCFICRGEYEKFKLEKVKQEAS